MAGKQLTCLIIEDEPIAAEVLEDYIHQVPFLNLKDICSDAIFALEKLRETPIDVLFLDIHLPKLKGLDFLRSIQQPPQTILTTAYDQYALDAFEVNVVDYLLKPIEFSRFLKAVNKLQRPDGYVVKSTVATNNSTERPFHFFNVNKRMIKVYFDEVYYIESLKDYSRIVTKDGHVVTRGQIHEMETFFPPEAFLRIHRSYIVSIEKIKAYSAVEVQVGDKVLPIGRSYKGLVSRVLS